MNLTQHRHGVEDLLSNTAKHGQTTLNNTTVFDSNVSCRVSAVSDTCVVSTVGLRIRKKHRPPERPVSLSHTGLPIPQRRSLSACTPPQAVVTEPTQS